MSCYSWESGTITLPSAEVAKVRKVLIDSVNAVRDLVPEEIAKAHAAGGGTRSEKLYRERVLQWEGYFAKLRDDASTPRWQRATEAEQIAREVAYQVINGALYRSGKVMKPTKAMIDEVLPRATNRTTAFPALSIHGLGDGMFALTGRELGWSVEENNHAREHADQSPVALAVWVHLDRIIWTRGSGGQTVGNDEYNRDSDIVGGGGNYLIREYGPDVKKAASATAGLLLRFGG